MTIRVAIVDDDNSHMLILKHIVSGIDNCEIIWTATNGKYAVDKAAANTPDLILMDLVMPVMDGVNATKKIMTNSPCAILIVTSSVSVNSTKVFDAMGAGAVDAVSTPILDNTNKSSSSLQQKIITISRLIQNNITGQPVRKSNGPAPDLPRHHNTLVALGTSTGGPGVLAHILSNLPADLSAPVTIVQHVDQYFSNSLAEWLDSQTELDVCLACGDEKPEPGKVYLAATGYHMVIMNNGRLGYSDKPDDIIYRPSIDVFFESIAHNWQGNIIAGLLTGMGRDGAAGLLNIRKRGGYTFAQDEASSTVYGMPKAAIANNATENIFNKDEIPSILLKYIDSYAKVGSQA